MQREPIQFGTVAASRAKRSAAGFTQPARRSRKSMDNAETASVMDQVFADYSRADAGSPASEPAAAAPANWRATTRELIADISAQLETLNSQRRQLARLLETVETNTTV